VPYRESDELTWVDTMSERKARMIDTAEAFVALPGGFGTLEEMSEVITLKQFDIVRGPLVAVNTRGFYDSLVAFFERFYADNFAKPVYRATCAFVPTPADALSYIQGYVPPPPTSKWYH
jgi:cytokinin riboside 5'-monophosphate phosphoribohydrolase